MGILRLQLGGVALSTVGTVQAPPIPQVPDIDFAGFQQGVALQARTNESLLRRAAFENHEARAGEARRRSFMDLRAKFGIPVHNKAQQAAVDAVAEDVGIRPEDLASMDLNNPYIVKDLDNKFATAVSDPRFLRVMGEVQAADRLRLMAHNRLNASEVQAWEQAWRGYQQLDTPGTGFDLNTLSASRFKTPPAAKPADLGSVFKQTVDDLEDIDLDSPEGLEDIRRAVTLDLIRTNPQAAMERGLLRIGNNGIPEVPDAVFDDVVSRIRAQQTGGGETEDRLGTGVTAAELRSIMEEQPDLSLSQALDVQASRNRKRNPVRGARPSFTERRARELMARGEAETLEEAMAIINGNSGENNFRFGNDSAGRFAEFMARDFEAVGIPVDGIEDEILGVAKITGKDAQAIRPAQKRELIKRLVEPEYVQDIANLNALLFELGKPQVTVDELQEGAGNTVFQILQEELSWSAAEIREVLRNIAAESPEQEPSSTSETLGIPEEFLDFERRQ